MRFWGLQPDNPILRAEIAYQRRTIPRWLQWFDRFGVVVVALGVGVFVLYFPIINDLYGKNWSPSVDTLPVLLAVSWITQMVVILRCLFAGFNSMRHHYGQQGWDMLVLTGMSIRQLLAGKWWAALYQLRGWLLALGIIKLAVFAHSIIQLIMYCYRSPLDMAIRSIPFYGGNTPLYETALMQIPSNLIMSPSVNRLVITGVFIVVISLLEVIASSSVGMVGGLVPEKVIGLIATLMLRLAFVVGFTLFPDYAYAGGNLLWRWYEYTWFSFADGGSTAILRSGLAFHGYAENAGNTTGNISGVIWAVLIAFYAAIGMYLVYLLFAIGGSHILLRRRGLLPVGSK